MLGLREVKTGLAEAALGEGVGGTVHQLSVKDIKYVCVPMALHLSSSLADGRAIAIWYDDREDSCR